MSYGEYKHQMGRFDYILRYDKIPSGLDIF